MLSDVIRKHTIMEDKESKVYELGYLILPSVAEDKLKSVVDKIKGIISEKGGKEIDGEEPFKYDLAYTMSKTIGASRYVVNDAYIGWIKFELPLEEAAELKKGVDLIEEVLRTMLIRAPRETSFSFAKAREKAQKEAEEARRGSEPEEVPEVPSEEVVE